MTNVYQYPLLRTVSKMSIKKIIIPARAGSKGWPRKNVSLFDYTAGIVPQQYKKLVTVTTDDPQICGLSETYKFKIHQRSHELAEDHTDTKSTLVDALKNNSLKKDDIIIMLYLTYPGRQWGDVESMYNTFVSNQYKSMLCKQPVKTHPYLVMYEKPDMCGELVVDHKMYQRQQYPECFEISHYICMFRYGELKKLNKNMYNTDTRFYNIDRCIDVDSETDFNLFKSQHEHKNSN